MDVVLALACLASASGQASADVTVQPLTPQVEAAPGETVTLRLRLDNVGDERVAFTPEVTPPIGWSVLVPPGEVRLEAGASTVALITLLVPAAAEARTYVFPVGYRLDRDDPRQEAHFSVRVPSVDGVSLTLLEAPEYVTDAAFMSRFLVRNESNVRHTFELTTRGGGRPALRIDPATVDLGPGASTEVLVHADVPDDLTDSVRHVTTLEVAHPDLPDVRATARATSTLVPRSPSRAPRHHTIPLTARVAGGVAHGGAGESGPTVELTGTGTLTDHGEGTLSVRLKTPLADPAAIEEFVVEYRGADGRVSVGRRAFVRSPLASDERGFGVRVERGWRLATELDVAGTTQVYDGPSGWSATTSAHATIADAVRLGATLHASGEDLFATLEAGYRPRAAGARGLELAALETAYAVRVGVATADPSGSLRFHVRLRDGPSNVDLRYALEDAGFSDAATHRAKLDLKAALRLNTALDLDPASPLDLHLAYATDESWTDPRDIGGDESVRSLGGTLTARLGTASVSVGHRHGWRRDADVPDWDSTTHVQAYLPVGDGADLRQRVSWIRTPREDRVRYEGDVSVATSASGRLTASIDADVLHGPMRLDALEVGGRWAGAASSRLFLNVGVHVDLLGSGDRVTLSVGGRQRFANGHELDVEVTGKLRADGGSRASVDVGYAVPIQVPIGRRTDIGTIHGHVRTTDGEPLRGVLVTASGGMAVTDAEGAFALQAVPPGRQLVALIPSTIPIDDPVVTPSPPTWLDVVAGEATAVTFRIEAGATVTGRLVPNEPAGESGRDAVGPATDAARWLSGAIVELTDGSTTRRATTDASGAFRLASIPAGEWVVRLRHASLPDDFRVEPVTDVTLQLRPGAVDNVEFRLVPVRRAIRFQDGGRLGGSGDAD